MRLPLENARVMRKTNIAWYTDEDGHKLTKVVETVAQKFNGDGSAKGKPYVEYQVCWFDGTRVTLYGVTRKLSKAEKAAASLAERMVS